MNQEKQEQYVSPMMATYQAAFENVIIEAQNSATNRVLGQLARSHVTWHGTEGTEANADCHTCVLIGIVEKPAEADSPVEVVEPKLAPVE